MKGSVVPLGHDDYQSCLPVQLCLLHQRRRLRPQWNALPADQVVEEMTDLVKRYRFSFGGDDISG
jgi:hypothetical protein